MPLDNSKAKILVVEDDTAILKGLEDVLVFNGYEVKGVDDGEKGLQSGVKEYFDLIILDLMLPKMDGFSVLKAIRQKKPRQPILMLTAKGSEDDIVEGFNAGADDYVSKPFSIRELMVRIEALLRRTGSFAPPDQLTIKDIIIDGKKMEARIKNRVVPITKKELDILLYLYHNRDRIVSKNELLIKVWHYQDAGIETRTVDIHILKLRKKLTELIKKHNLILTIRGQGYRLDLE